VKLPKIKKGYPYLPPPKAIAAMLMVDFCNPVYSARRERYLIKYLPSSAKLNVETNTYDVADQLIANLEASTASKDPKSPEAELLSLLNTPDDTWISTFTDWVNKYAGLVSGRLGAQDGVEDDMALADGRRRMYQGRVDKKPGDQITPPIGETPAEAKKPRGSGLNEFTLTLPTALVEVLFTRMREDGYTEVMPKEDQEYFHEIFLEQRRMQIIDAHSGGDVPWYRRRAAVGSCPAGYSYE